MKNKNSKQEDSKYAWGPPLIYCHFTPAQQTYYRTSKIKSFEFYSISDGRKRIFTEEDALQGYGKQEIIDPNLISYMNLFVNGVLQPKKTYEVTKGKIILKTEDIPQCGTPIILQMIII